MNAFNTVFIESPYAGDVERNLNYLRSCIMDSMARGEAPFAGHGFYTSYLDDKKPDERKLGIAIGLVWGNLASKRVFYMDYGMSIGMLEGLHEAQKIKQPIEYRKILNK